MEPRNLPDRPLPAYAFVPGRHPHPVRDPGGHLFGQAAHSPSHFDPHEPGRSAEFLFAIDLFNHGYYWEAHEAWEGHWRVAGRVGPVATLMKALIKLAAAGVKAREGNAAGVQRHATRAAELFRMAAEMSGELHGLFEAIHGDRLLARCDDLAANPVVNVTHTIAGLPVLGMRIDLTG